MFSSFARVWTPVAFTEELGGRPLPLSLAGEPLVAFRNLDGVAGVLRDRCPHRDARLSLGHVANDGCLVCPFHGWRFTTEGACRATPLNVLPKNSERFNARSVPTREAGGLVWVFTATDVGANELPPLPVPGGLLEADTPVTHRAHEWNAHWTRVIENLIDFTHVPFLHAESVGRFMKSRLNDGSRFDVVVEREDDGFAVSASIDGRALASRIVWRAPNLVTIRLPGPRGWRLSHQWAVPTEGDRSRLLIAMEHTGLAVDTDRPNKLDFEPYELASIEEDRVMVESHWPGEVPPVAESASVATDAPSIAFRRYYFGAIRRPMDTNGG